MTSKRPNRRPVKSKDVVHGDIQVFEPKIPKDVKALLDSRKTLRLDIGCGGNKQPGAVGIDKRALPGVDIVHDLETFPWPIPTSSVRVAFLSHFLEHVKPWLFFDLMAEIHRIVEPGGQMLVAGPYGVEFRFVQDPTHILPINEATLAYLDKLHESGLWHVYEPPVFHLDHFEIIPVGSGRDFNAFLTCCKPSAAPCRHPKCPPLVAGTRTGRRGRGAGSRRAGASTAARRRG